MPDDEDDEARLGKQVTGARPDWRARALDVVRILTVAFVLHWMWEATHAVAFVESSGTLWFRVWHCLPMAVTDAGWTVVLWLIVGGLSTSPRRAGLWQLAALGVVGALTAVVLEVVAVSSGRWTYNDLMPLLPVIDVGLWPVLQMGILPVLTVRLSDWWKPQLV
ncbi:MAG: hypothetical protein IT180_02825 [Acidobacteria bacterium]|nr:hypothetical protein [Acidobacteriota bacterium]